MALPPHPDDMGILAPRVDQPVNIDQGYTDFWWTGPHYNRRQLRTQVYLTPTISKLNDWKHEAIKGRLVERVNQFDCPLTLSTSGLALSPEDRAYAAATPIHKVFRVRLMLEPITKHLSQAAREWVEPTELQTTEWLVRHLQAMPVPKITPVPIPPMDAPILQPDAPYAKVDARPVKLHVLSEACDFLECQRLAQRKHPKPSLCDWMPAECLTRTGLLYQLPYEQDMVVVRQAAVASALAIEEKMRQVLRLHAHVKPQGHSYGQQMDLGLVTHQLFGELLLERRVLHFGQSKHYARIFIDTGLDPIIMSFDSVDFDGWYQQYAAARRDPLGDLRRRYPMKFAPPFTSDARGIVRPMINHDSDKVTLGLIEPHRRDFWPAFYPHHLQMLMAIRLDQSAYYHHRPTQPDLFVSRAAAQYSRQLTHGVEEGPAADEIRSQLADRIYQVYQQMTDEKTQTDLQQFPPLVNAPEERATQRKMADLQRCINSVLVMHANESDRYVAFLEELYRLFLSAIRCGFTWSLNWGDIVTAQATGEWKITPLNGLTHMPVAAEFIRGHGIYPDLGMPDLRRAMDHVWRATEALNQFQLQCRVIFLVPKPDRRPRQPENGKCDPSKFQSLFRCPLRGAGLPGTQTYRVDMVEVRPIRFTAGYVPVRPEINLAHAGVDCQLAWDTVSRAATVRSLMVQLRPDLADTYRAHDYPKPPVTADDVKIMSRVSGYIKYFKGWRFDTHAQWMNLVRDMEQVALRAPREVCQDIYDRFVELHDAELVHPSMCGLRKRDPIEYDTPKVSMCGANPPHDDEDSADEALEPEPVTAKEVDELVPPKRSKQEAAWDVETEDDDEDVDERKAARPKRAADVETDDDSDAGVSFKRSKAKAPSPPVGSKRMGDPASASDDPPPKRTGASRLAQMASQLVYETDVAEAVAADPLPSPAPPSPPPMPLSSGRRQARRAGVAMPLPTPTPVRGQSAGPATLTPFTGARPPVQRTGAGMPLPTPRAPPPRPTPTRMLRPRPGRGPSAASAAEPESPEY